VSFVRNFDRVKKGWKKKEGYVVTKVTYLFHACAFYFGQHHKLISKVPESCATV